MEPIYRPIHQITLESEAGQKENVLVTNSVLIEKFSYQNSSAYIFQKTKPIRPIYDISPYVILITKEDRVVYLEKVDSFKRIIEKLIEENWPRDIILQVGQVLSSYGIERKDNVLIQDVINSIDEYGIAEHII